MTPIVRWLLVFPTSVAAMVAAYVGGLIIWKLVYYITIVPQGNIISASLATAGICAVAAAAGVAAGAAIAPSHKEQTAWTLCVISIIAGLLLLGEIDISRRVAHTIPLLWRLVMIAGWIGGAILAARAQAASPDG